MIETNIRERLDRGVANNQRLAEFLYAQIRHYVHSFFDHCPIMIDLKGNIQEREYKNSDSKLGGSWRRLWKRKL